ncbi:growth/differentiation factor 10b [Salarias fasciatus]|uniref:growth/differentiation factor 10b n=1 Tax=Salarias fasciatus TaxID=181472 RepID=UPI001176A4A8|nr:interferon gamma receptor 1 [Salarias fasciatus]
MGFASLCPVSCLVLWMSVVAASVEPPANVTLHCQSMNNVLKWDYDQITPGLRFRVDIGAYYKTNVDGFRNVSWVEAPAREADLSFLSDPSEAYFLTVTAVDGDQESDPSPSEDGITFSYFKDADVNHICFVELPSVNVTAQPHDSVLLRFQHPWLMLHREVLGDRPAKTRKKKSHDALLSDDLPVFDYRVAIVNQEKQDHHSYLCEEEVCEESLPVDPQQKEHCLTISGDLEQMVVKGDQVYCALPFEIPPSDDHTYTFVFVAVGLLTVVLALVLLMYFRKKTKAYSETPDPLIFSSPSSPRTLEVEPSTLTGVEVVASTPLTEVEPDVPDFIAFTPPATDSSDYTHRRRLGLPSEDEGVSNDIEEERPGGEESAYMHGGLDEDDVPSSYEPRGVQVQLEPGDTAEGYRG